MDHRATFGHRWRLHGSIGRNPNAASSDWGCVQIAWGVSLRLSILNIA